MDPKTLSYSVTPFFLVLSLFCCVAPFPYPYNQLDYSQLDYSFYDKSCPHLPMIVKYGVWAAFKNDNRMAASLLRLHFHDCFVNGCDASILLDDSNGFKGEKNAFPNRNSARGYEVIDSIKTDVEKACPLTVSCTDILTLAAKEAVVLSGGPSWPIPLGRRDGVTASEKAANDQLPSPIEPLENITAKFTSKGLDMKDVVVLSGAHTIGFAQCFTFKGRLFNFKESGQPDPTLETSALTNLQSMCPKEDSSNSNLAPLDSTSVYRFDNLYYTSLVNNRGVLGSDQALMGDPNTAALVQSYSMYPYLFASDFAASMMRLGNVGILTGKDGQIRKKCGSVN
ncbi:peroxidase 10 [Tripterygium wilfordii]|uniref:peroxidase 10 n=1 Tax=Tripterygium wilfordii TaxID=458696 RepID=UPI0018F82762|nr:peroxidase 10 [Tripterygium wilfordii]